MTLPVTAESVDPATRDAAIASLRQVLGDRLSSAASVREQHGKDAFEKLFSSKKSAKSYRTR
jgi:hypothetical protein